jgi:sec-independent protein translocase protein TatA
MLGGIGTWEILLIFLALLLMFGAKRIPEIAKGLGKGVTEFKNAIHDVKSEIEAAPESRPAASPGEPARPGPEDASPDPSPDQKEKT